MVWFASRMLQEHYLRDSLIIIVIKLKMELEQELLFFSS